MAELKLKYSLMETAKMLEKQFDMSPEEFAELIRWLKKYRGHLEETDKRRYKLKTRRQEFYARLKKLAFVVLIASTIFLLGWQTYKVWHRIKHMNDNAGLDPKIKYSIENTMPYEEGEVKRYLEAMDRKMEKAK